jgi:hypothetical protein
MIALHQTSLADRRAPIACLLTMHLGRGIHLTRLTTAPVAWPLTMTLNASPDMACMQGANPESDEDADFWGYQYCTEMFMPFAKDGGVGGGGGDGGSRVLCCWDCSWSVVELMKVCQRRVCLCHRACTIVQQLCPV